MTHMYPPPHMTHMYPPPQGKGTQQPLLCRSLYIYIYIYMYIYISIAIYIYIYEDFPCNSKQELNRREGEVIREIGTINKQIAGRTKKEYPEKKILFYRQKTAFVYI
jgi:hypothetical protein